MGGIEKWKFTEIEEWILGGDCRVVICTSKVVKMKEHLPYCREFSIICIEDRVAVDCVV